EESFGANGVGGRQKAVDVDIFSEGSVEDDCQEEGDWPKWHPGEQVAHSATGIQFVRALKLQAFHKSQKARDERRAEWRLQLDEIEETIKSDGHGGKRKAKSKEEFGATTASQRRMAAAVDKKKVKLMEKFEGALTPLSGADMPSERKHPLE
ncbi:unnamed protein product, partial [Prorocentrum cordatum]